MNNIEILSPAGSIESLKTAINASCDAIYIGGSMFGARAYADNPKQDVLIDAIDYAHIHGKKIYLTVNTLLKNGELEDKLYDYIYKYYINGVDAVIVQDLGVLRFIHENFPDLPIHASTQMTLTMAEGANVLADYGVTRFVPSRELGLDELIEMRKNTDLEIEVFVHGSLCYSYSGQCLMSSVFNGRSGNRGRCAQPCRMPYTLLGNVDSLGQENLELSSNKDKYLLSPKDICTLDYVPDLLDIGIDSFKIEGRMKRPEYTAITTYTYKKYVDKYLELGRQGYQRYIYDNQKEYKQDKMNLMDIYNRGGFSGGYLNQRNGRSMITLDKPNHSGVEVGKVSRVTKNRIWIDLEEDINKADVLRIVGQDREKDFYEYTSGSSHKAGQETETNYDRRVSLQVDNKVYRVRNNALIDYLDSNFIQANYLTSIDGKVDVVVGEELSITLISDDLSVKVLGDIVEEARNQPMSEEKIKKQVIKTNDTNFVFNNLEINIKGRPFIPVSKLNELRRQGIVKLEEKLISRYYRNLEIREMKDIEGNKSTKDYINNELNNSNEKVKIHVVVHSIEQAYAAATQPEVSAIYLDSDIVPFNEMQNLFNHIKDKGKKVYLYMPHIFRKLTYDYYKNKIEDPLSVLLDDKLDGYVIRNLEEYDFINKYILKGSLANEIREKEIIADYNLYVMNKEAVKMLNELGVKHLTAPVELNRNELKELKGLYDTIIVYGRTPLMVTAQCPMKTVSGGDNKHLNKTRNNYCCGNDVSNIQLVDRLNVEFPVVRNCKHCYNTIYNSLPLSLLRYSNDVKSLDSNNIRLDFTIESKEETIMVLDKFIQVFYYEDLTTKDIDNYTRVHFNRGIE